MERRRYEKKKGRRRGICFLLCLCLIFVVASFSSNAAASSKALKFLRGKWYSADGSYYVVFTKKYAKYYEGTWDDCAKRYKRFVYKGKKGRIVSDKKTKTGYLIKLKAKWGKYCYESRKIYGSDLLDFYGTWNRGEFYRYYSGSSSLER